MDDELFGTETRATTGYHQKAVYISPENIGLQNNLYSNEHPYPEPINAGKQA